MKDFYISPWTEDNTDHGLIYCKAVLSVPICVTTLGFPSSFVVRLGQNVPDLMHPICALENKAQASFAWL